LITTTERSNGLACGPESRNHSEAGLSDRRAETPAWDDRRRSGGSARRLPRFQGKGVRAFEQALDALDRGDMDEFLRHVHEDVV
jgi:hypothetical protein